MKPLTPQTPHLIIMVGIPGAGKTTFAEHFAKMFQAPYINPRTISEVVGIDAEATERVTKLLFDELLKTNRTLIYEGSTYTKTQRTALDTMAKKAGYHPLFVWVQTDPYESKKRATKLKNSASLTSDEFDDAFRQFQNPSSAEKAVVISGKHTYATQLKVVLKRLSVEARSETPPASIPPRPPRGRNITVR